MSAQDLILGARVAHLAELKREVAKLKEQNDELRNANASIAACFSEALLAAEDLRTLPEGGVMEIWDGWNLILGATREAKDRDALVACAKRRLEADAKLRVWIVFDGPRERAQVSGRLRVSYTGGTGEQRADRFITDYIRMALYLGLVSRVRVRTHDKVLEKKISSYFSTCASQRNMLSFATKTAEVASSSGCAVGSD